MNINSDVNILGGLSDIDLIANLMNENIKSSYTKEAYQTNSIIKTVKSYKRFENAIKQTLLTFSNQNLDDLIHCVFVGEGLSADCLTMLFWNASVNNDLLDYMNQNVYFPALYSGRVTINSDEVAACLRELSQTEVSMQKWSDSTVYTTASKYLTLLRKFNLMEGGKKKTIATPRISDQLIVLFVYWLLSIETKANILESKWLQYCFLEKDIFIQQIMQKRFMKYFNLQYTVGNLRIEPTLSYKEIYNELK